MLSAIEIKLEWAAQDSKDPQIPGKFDDSAPSGALVVQDARLARLIEAWPTLDEETKAAIVAICEITPAPPHLAARGNPSTEFPV